MQFPGKKPAKTFTTTQKRAAHNIGVDAESLVASQLQQNGWEIIQFRLKTPYGEIDMIARKPQRLLIVEVKFTHRSDDSYIETTLPNPQEQKRVLDATQYFISVSDDYAEASIEFVIALVRKNKTVKYIKDWLEGAAS